MTGRRTIALAAAAVALMAAPALAGAQDSAVDSAPLATDPVVDRGPLATLTAGQPSVSAGRVVAVARFTRRSPDLAGQIRVGLYRAAPNAKVGRRVATNSLRFARGGSLNVFRLPVSARCVPAQRGTVWFTVATAGYRVGPLGALVTLKAKSRGSLLRCNRG